MFLKNTNGKKVSKNSSYKSLLNSPSRTREFDLWMLLVLSVGMFSPFWFNPQHAIGTEWFFDKESKIPEEERLTKEDLEFIKSVYNSIQVDYIENVDKKTLIEGALKGMVQSLKDPYSEFLDAQERAPFDDSLEGSFSGIGVQFMIENGLAKVIAPVDGTPAAEAGIQPNDIILKADQETLEGKSTSEIMSLIRGEVGSKVTLTIDRAGKTFEVELTRAEIPLTTVDAELDKENPQIAWIRISQFALSTYDEMVDAIKSMRDQGAKAFVFDLRFNPGGLLDTAMQVANMFLDDGQTIMGMEDRAGNKEQIQASDKLFGDFQVTEPFVILVDEGSASASEILAAAIKENTDHQIIGTKTFGKGTAQNMPVSSDYGELKITIAKWLTPEGHWIHEQGVEPDQKVEQDPIYYTIQLNSEEELKEKDTNEYVASASIILNSLGYSLKETPYFNEEMVKAVKSFQKDNQLEENGKIDKATANALTEKARAFIKEHDAQYDKARENLTKELQGE